MRSRICTLDTYISSIFESYGLLPLLLLSVHDLSEVGPITMFLKCFSKSFLLLYELLNTVFLPLPIDIFLLLELLDLGLILINHLSHGCVGLSLCYGIIPHFLNLSPCVLLNLHCFFSKL